MTSDPSVFAIRLAQDEADLLGAARLRYDVFVEELGGDGPRVDHANRYERDSWDPHFDHLILVDTRKDPATHDHVIGVYRVMPPERSAAAGGYYSDAEYDLTPILETGRKALELGRTCVHRDHRSGNATYRLWNGLAAYVTEREIELLFGVASYHGTDLTALAEPLSYLHHHHLAPPDLRARARGEPFQPLDLLPADEINRGRAMRATPALIKAYLRLGGSVGEGAFVDHSFNTTDVFMIVDTAKISDARKALYLQEKL